VVTPADEDAKAALQRAELTMKHVQRVARLGTWTWHLATNRLEWSDEMFRIFGIAREGFDGDLTAVIAAAVHPDDRALVERVNRSVLDEGKPQPLGYRVVWPDGTIRFVWGEAAELHRDATGRPTMLTGIVQDITDRKRADEAVRVSEEKFSKAFTLAPVAMSLSRLEDGLILEVNSTFTSMFGFTREEAVGATSTALGLWGTEEERRAAVGLVRSGAVVSGREIECRAKGGALKAALLSVQSIDLGGVECVLASITDITAHKATERALRASQAKLSTALESMTDAVFVCDADGGLVDLNEAFASFHRFPSKAECLRNLAEYSDLFEVSFATGEVVPFDSWPALRARRGETATNAEYVIRRKNAGESWVGSYSFAPIRDAAGAVVGAVIVARDITERTRALEERTKLEAQLQQALKMESVGRLAGGVAHDFNNMLSVILGHTEIAIEEMDPSDRFYEDFVEIRKAARRSADLTHQLLAFARKQTIVPRRLDLNAAAGAMLTMLRRLVGENIRLQWRPGADLWLVKIDPSQVDQILTHLCANARAAIADVGTLSIETGNTTFDAAYAASHAETLPGDYVRLVVRDDGSGMDKPTLAKAFEPFFTTRPVGEGTGLGLATVYGIVKQNNGFIDVVSAPGAGATFTIYLPRETPSGDAVGKVAPSSVAPALRGYETVLLVEDEESVLRVTRRMLEVSGYRVLSATRPAEAIRMAREHAGRIHLLLTDVVMPDMNGHDLAKVIRSIDPQVRRLYMSGYAAGVLAQAELDDGERFIQKPFSLKGLMAKVREVLDW
jgi:two-component system, cell cycle sensor histidine kinase and response regulator CckA